VDLRRPGMATEDSIVGFQMQRIYCGLANAPGWAVVQYTQEYKLNQNPVIASADPAGARSDPVEVPPLSPGARRSGCGWADGLVDSQLARRLGGELPAWDVLTHTLPNHNEAMRVSWYATAGSFEHDITGRSDLKPKPSLKHVDPGTPGLVHLWVVLHDSRGGTDFAGYDLEVTP